MAEERTVTLDVRDLSPWERHPKIFDLLDSLQVGETLELVNDHNPAPLHYQLMAERKGQFTFEAQEKAVHEWVAHIKKVAAEPIVETEETVPGTAQNVA